MKVNTFLLILILLLAQKVNADNFWMIKAGVNYSELRNIKAKSFFSYSIGIERKIPIWSFLSINPEILWSKQGGIIKNKPVWTDSYYGGLLFYYDINIIRTSMDMSIIFDFPIFSSDDITISIRPFPSFHTEGFKDHNLDERERIEINEDWDNYKFEFKQGDYEHFPFDFKTGWSLNLSFLINYKRFLIETRYMKNLNSIGQVAQLHPLRYKLHSIHFLVGYAF
jgi:hypothetical protein